VNPDDEVTEESAIKKVTTINTKKCLGNHFQGLESGISEKML
jgi:hypothetical protein